MGGYLKMDDQRNHHECSSSSTKVERKVIEKNRRNQMKNLYSMLSSLLPNQTSQEALPLPDQIDEAVNYIKTLEKKLQESKEKKQNLMGSSRKRPLRSYSAPTDMASSSSIPPQIEIHETGSTLELILTSGLDNQFIFYEVIRILHEESAEVVSANFSVVGNKILHVVHAEIGDAIFSTFGATKISERLNQFVNGSTSEGELDLELQQFPQFWDFEIHPESWQF
ncbi:hypothetical protein Dsin_031413 [Dipteronia sinensis]|uniref:BHLH domain-containing protein n=1 Tax=Dipteronia sinensis TaxID=43782 RepID=A0AAE0DSD5_9ROSI|nr:hypothetical protein Dsin_031413 [Dipteronia sinensis]